MSLQIASYIGDRIGAIMTAQRLRIALDIPDGPGALKGLSLASVALIRSVEKVGNWEWRALGGLLSVNWWSGCVGSCTGGKNVLASASALSSFFVAMVPFWAFSSGMRCRP